MVQIVLVSADACLQQAKKDTIDDFNNVLRSIDNKNKILLIQKTTLKEYKSAQSTLNGYIDFIDVVLIEEDIRYISAKYNTSRANKYDLYNYSNKRFYGEVSYIKSKSEITDLMHSYLNSFDILRWASYFPS